MASAAVRPLRRRNRLRNALRPRRRRQHDRRHDSRHCRARLRERRNRVGAAGVRRAAAPVVGAAGSGRLARRAGPCGSGRDPLSRRRPVAHRRRRHGVHRVDAAPGSPRRNAAVPGRGIRAAAARLPEALEAPRGAAPGGTHHRARCAARRAVARAVRRPHLLRVGACEGAAGPRGGPRRVRRRRPLDRGRRLDRVAALRSRDAQRVHRGLQGPVPGRAVSVDRLLRRAAPVLRALRRRQARAPAVAARRAAQARSPRRRRCSAAFPKASPSPWGTSTRTSPRRRRARSSRGTCSPSWAPRRATS